MAQVKQVLGLFHIAVQRDVQAVEQTYIQTDVQVAGFFPFQIGVTQVVCHQGYLIVVLGRNAGLGQIVVRAARLVSVDTVRNTGTQFVDPGHVFHEGFFVDVPSAAYRPECTPTLVATETAGTVAAHHGLKHVFAVVSIVSVKQVCRILVFILGSACGWVVCTSTDDFSTLRYIVGSSCQIPITVFFVFVEQVCAHLVLVAERFHEAQQLVGVNRTRIAVCIVIASFGSYTATAFRVSISTAVVVGEPDLVV